MSRPVRNPDRPPTHPGSLLRLDVLPALDLTQEQLAHRLGVSRISVSQVLNARRALTAAMAVKLEAELKVSAELLLSMQQALDLWQARRQLTQSAPQPEMAVYTDAKRESDGAIATARFTSALEIAAKVDGESLWTRVGAE